jgi:hypothetical protein
MARQSSHLVSHVASLAAVAALIACGGDAGDVSAQVAAGGVTVRDVMAYQGTGLVLFAGQRAPGLAPRARPQAPVTVEPALPPGLSLDAATGAVRGTPRRAVAGAIHVLRDARGATSTLWVEVLARPDPKTSRFASPSGSDDNPGSIDRPFRTVTRAVRDLGPGMTLFLRKGVYRESVELRKLAGTAAAPIHIRSYPGERAVIDASQAIFADSPARAWERSKEPGAHPDEWISTQTYSTAGKDSASRGAFLDRPSYTRLLTYSRLEDLRAANQTWDEMAGDDDRPGPRVKANKRHPAQPGRARLPWTYFGPGIHFDKQTGRIHIRLSPTRHGVAGMEEYRGPTDPRKVRLSISSRTDRALEMLGSEHVRVSDVGLWHGGDETVRVQGSSDVVLDHVEIRAATYGLVIGESQRVHVLHSRLEGGIPPWSFRSDFKGSYKIESDGDDADKDGDRGTDKDDDRDTDKDDADKDADGVGKGAERPETNNLVRKTQRALLFMARHNVDVEVAYCDIADGHDVYVSGTRTDFHHNHIHNIHDEALYLQTAPDESGLRVHHNVVEKVLSGVSFFGKGTGARYIYRNVLDLRAPTAGHRPGAGRGREAWRYGHPFKNTGNLGTTFFYQNTVLVNRPQKTPFLQFSAFGKDQSQLGQRWFLNNVFVVLQPGPDFDQAVSFVPPPELLALRGKGGQPLFRSDGNLWVRVGSHQRPLFRCTATKLSPACGREKYWRLADVTTRTPTFEAHSREAASPGFIRAPSLERTGAGDDLRPGRGSPALGLGIALPSDLPDPDRRRVAHPDAGALAAGQGPLRVGVDAGLVY